MLTHHWFAQEDSLRRLQNRINVSYDSTVPEHQVSVEEFNFIWKAEASPQVYSFEVDVRSLLQETLKALWKMSYAEEELRDIISEQWKEMGWQGKDPSTDFRCTSVFFPFVIPDISFNLYVPF